MSDVEIFWRVDRMEWDVVQGGVVSVYWSVVARKDGVEGTSTSRTHFSPDPDDPSFVPVADITEDMALDWVKKGLVQVQIDNYERQAKNALTRNLLPPLVTGLPWKMPS